MRDALSLQRTSEMLAAAFGEAIGAAFADPDVTEIMVNPDGKLWLDRHSLGRVFTGLVLAPADVERVIRLVASQAGRDVTPAAPMVSAELPVSGERFEGSLPPVTAAPSFSIRKPSVRVIGLEQYVAFGALSAFQAEALRVAVRERVNILIAGGTGSGKTTLANALLAEIALTGDRVVILEDTRELLCAAEDSVAMRTVPGAVSLADLVRSTLRRRPDRIIIGEVRGPEALDMLKAWNTGHPGGIATLHANSAHAALFRLEQLVGEVTAAVPHELIAEAIGMVVFIARSGGKRRVETIARVTGLSDNGYALQPVTPVLRLLTNPDPIPATERTPS
jgi:P-type conjugative transfer ATPase TrbB